MTARMTILRAVRELEMDCDIDESTDIVHIERDNPDQVTVYGKEEDGKLWYLTLNQEAVKQIATFVEQEVQRRIEQALIISDEVGQRDVEEPYLDPELLTVKIIAIGAILRGQWVRNPDGSYSLAPNQRH